MKRLSKIIFLLLVMILSMISFQNVSAAAKNLPDGFLVGDEDGINITKDGGYFFNLDDLKPGDMVKRKLIIKNLRDEAYDLKLVIRPKSKTGKIDLIENISMQILFEDQEVYQGNLGTNNDGSKEVSFGSIAARSEKAAVIDLVVNDVKKWNQLYYSGPSEAEVEWQFIAISSEKGKDQKESVPPKSAGNKQSFESGGKGLFPRAGEILKSRFIWIGLIFVAIVCLIAVKRNRSKNI
ncbi:hypothetical protein [Candidatus Enterococcus murrayae]|uniref:Uncharacterized protein n=1 Tax=Candidatus Enterococcus murrayae TaxID=2815321 RepID=A0ABS3HNM8_9ENTE|nr:hypothetical protein [Enterococcus sp. MJM16]MBO0454485.1 hypothetical protein [Enterococcus sp. MJM16]